MINIQISGTLPKINTNLEPAMEQIGDLMFDSVLQNFLAGGRPDQWAPLKKTGEPSHLFQNGFLVDNIHLEWGSDSTSVYVNKAAYYAPYLQYGTKKMVARPFMMFQGIDKEKILQILSNVIFIENGEPV
jgi:phage gpG-like protein